jgi:rRNA maturation RNase YbeY
LAIRFFSDGISFQLEEKRRISRWLKQVVTDEGKKIENLSYVFVSNEFILDVNTKYLQHEDYTDIITFDDSVGDSISGEMYISIETVQANAKDYQVDFSNELLRVMVHGVLHLCGYKDQTTEEQQKMRAAEDKYLMNIQGARSKEFQKRFEDKGGD